MDAVEFWNWVEQELERRDLSYYRMEKDAGLSNAAISKQARNWSTPTLTACKAIAQAFDLPAEYVLRKAGHLPSRSPLTRFDEFVEISEILANLPDGPIRHEAMAAILAIARDARRRAWERERETTDLDRAD